MFLEVSIIVPVYNVEQYIIRCIESILAQSLNNMEIILVDDGSTDNSGRICDAYSLKDIRIKVVHQINKGLSEARNIGIEKARGAYIMFIDSDDYIESNTLGKLITECKRYDLDILAADYKEVYENGRIIFHKREESLKDKIVTGEEFLYYSLKNKNYMPMMSWLNLYRREFIINHNLIFKQGILHEDEEWTPRVFIRAQKVKYISCALYNYMLRECSITNQKDRTQNGIDIINTCYELGREYNKVKNKPLRKLLNNYLVMLYLSGFIIGKLYRKEYKQLINKSFLCAKSSTLKNHIKVFLFIINMNLYYKFRKILKG